MRTLVITLSLAGLLGACGHKTALELPKSTSAPVKTPAPAQAPASPVLK